MQVGLGPSADWEAAPEFPEQRASTLFGAGADLRLGPVVSWQLTRSVALNAALEGQLGMHGFSNADGFLEMARVMRAAVGLSAGGRFEL